ncbi:hypothetical protein MiSe_71590 [Microseira wollei NIES-4236]|uniref:Uncharacterized protein n=1 Tax=Microseira wollei NIES-4236 TaxID=2530354 RepID=A0AAV3XL78_9CYAN|nr:hypothetical protein MiSe_71590 [Microseira wollei NIES-4236]
MGKIGGSVLMETNGELFAAVPTFLQGGEG